MKSNNPADRVRAVWSTHGAVWNKMVSLHTPQQIGGKEHYRSGSHKGVYIFKYVNGSSVAVNTLTLVLYWVVDSIPSWPELSAGRHMNIYRGVVNVA